MKKHRYKQQLIICLVIATILIVFSGVLVLMEGPFSTVEAASSSIDQRNAVYQEGTTPTAPTEEPDEDIDADTDEADLTPAPTIEPFLQSDLTILSGNVQRPNGLYWHEDYIYTACSGDFTLYRIQDTTGETITYVAGVQNAHSLYVERNPANEIDVYVPDFQRNTFAKVTEGPRLETVVEELTSPWGVDVADDGSFFITQLRGDNVLHVQRDGSFEVVAEGFRNPTGVAVDNEYIYVGNNGSARRAIEWFDLRAYAGTPIPEEELQPLVQGLQNTTNVVMGPDRLLYFAYSLGTRGVVGRVDPERCRESGGCTNVDVEIVLWSELAAPLAGLTLSDDMRLFVHTMFGSEIYWVQLPIVPTAPTTS